MNESVEKWLAELETAPREAVHKLVLGYAGVSAWARSSLRESLIEACATHKDPLDAALARWLEERVMTLPPEPTPKESWALRMQDLFGAVAGLPLPQVERLLGERRREFREWLKPLRMDQGIDPEAAYLSALAWSSGNRGIEGMWRGFALRTGREPFYYVDIGLLGLRKVRDDEGRLPPEPPQLLLATLIDMADQCPGITKKKWLRTARSLMGGYYYETATWMRLFTPVLSAKTEAKNAPKWLAEILPDMTPERSWHASAPPNSAGPIPLDQSEKMIQHVAQFGPGSKKVHKFLERHRNYASKTGNPYFLVRTFNRLAEAAAEHDPEWAVARAEEIMEWEPDNVYCWMALAHALWARGLQARGCGNTNQAAKDCQQAIETLWEARYRFPADAHVRSELGKLLRYSGDNETAEAVYREALEQFPRNRYVHAGLARILFRRSAENRDDVEREEARHLLQTIAGQGDTYAVSLLQSFDDEWARLASDQNVPPGEEEQKDERQSIELPQVPLSEMRPAQRLGRALVRLWQARNTKSAAEKVGYFAKAEELLYLEPELAGECHEAIIEARGFLLLARGEPREALSYFEQLREQSQSPSLAVRLGLFEARTQCGQMLDDQEEAELESFGQGGSILPLVLKTVRLIEATPDEDALRDLLMELYPRVCKLAQMPASEIGEKRYPRDIMIANVLFYKVFSPTGIHDERDLNNDQALSRLRKAFMENRGTAISSLEQMALAE